MATYDGSQLQFYYSYISKEPADTAVPTAYSVSGQCMHSMAEDFSSLPKEVLQTMDVAAEFEKYWQRFKVDFQTTVNRKPLKKADYLKAAYYIQKLALSEDSTPIHSELTLRVKELEVSNDEFEIKVKGVVDRVLQMKDGTKKIVDFKTSSSIDEGEHFRKQVAFYCWAYAKNYGEKIRRCDIEYVKLGKTKTYMFTDEEIDAVTDRVASFISEIMKKGRDISQYSLGDIGGIFNGHIKKCLAEKTRREQLESQKTSATPTSIEVGIKNNRIYFNHTLPEKLQKALDAKFKYQVAGYQFSPLYQKRIWDGYKRFYKRKSLPLAFKLEIEQLVRDFNVYYSTNYDLVYTDFRDKDILNYQTTNIYHELPYDLRYYQKDAVKAAIENNFGILYLGTSAGKSLIAAEIIRQTKAKSLYIINRVELVDQTALEFEKYLGVKIGKMYEGQLSIEEDIIVASVQTIIAILKRHNDETKKLVYYLNRVNLSLFDECHSVKDDGIYEEVASHLKNIKWCIGLTGTPERF